MLQLNRLYGKIDGLMTFSSDMEELETIRYLLENAISVLDEAKENPKTLPSDYQEAVCHYRERINLISKDLSTRGIGLNVLSRFLR